MIMVVLVLPQLITFYCFLVIGPIFIWLVLFDSVLPMAAGQANLLLSDLSPSVRRVTILARVARAWEFYKDNELMHLDIVFVDEKGTKMYGEIHAAHAEKFRDKLIEGNLCLIKDFFVNSSKNMYKAVEGSFMIKLTPWSKVEVQHDIPAGYPRYAYSLTDFDYLHTMIGRTDMFIDVIGILSGISDLQKVRLPGRAKESDKRNLQITDIDGNIMDVALWGNHAISFQADDLYNLGQKDPIIILFVGTLIKSYLEIGIPTISCSDAAKVYINPDMAEINWELPKVPKKHIIIICSTIPCIFVTAMSTEGDSAEKSEVGSPVKLRVGSPVKLR